MNKQKISFLFLFSFIIKNMSTIKKLTDDGSSWVIYYSKDNTANKKIIRGYISNCPLDKDESFSIEEQLIDIKTFANKYDYYIEAIYYDKNVSYKEQDIKDKINRLGLFQLIEDIKKDEVCVMMSNDCLYRYANYDCNFAFTLERKLAGLMIIDLNNNMNVITDDNTRFSFNVSAVCSEKLRILNERKKSIREERRKDDLLYLIQDLIL